MATEPVNKKQYVPNDPITSYGILLFYVDFNDQIWYLLAQRRDTIEYTDFIRGRYSQLNLEIYFRLMTSDERKRLTTYTFDELWDDLWVNHDNSFYKDMRSKAQAKYESNSSIMNTLLETTVSITTEPSWGFPKGKKNLRETELECSFREFKEETKISLDYHNLLNLPPSAEVFKGSNGKLYKTVYYIAQVNHKIPIHKITPNGIRTETVSEEISNLMWGTMKDLIPKLPVWRQKLLRESERKIITCLNTNHYIKNSLPNEQ